MLLYLAAGCRSNPINFFCLFLFSKPDRVRILHYKSINMSWAETFWGHGSDLTSLQMATRAVVCFFTTLLFLRIAGVRTFGRKSAFDNVITIMLGSVFSRTVVGASPFWPTTIACFVFVLIHQILGRLSFHYGFVGRLIKGDKILLFESGQQKVKNMRKANISAKDLLESVRLQINEDDFTNVKEIFMERSGEISVITRNSG